MALEKPKDAISFTDLAGVVCLTPAWNDFQIKLLVGGVPADAETGETGKQFAVTPFFKDEKRQLWNITPVRTQEEFAALGPGTRSFMDLWLERRNAGDLAALGTSSADGLRAAVEEGPLFISFGKSAADLAGPKVGGTAMFTGDAGGYKPSVKLGPIQPQPNVVIQAGPTRSVLPWVIGGALVLGVVAYYATQKKPGYRQNAAGKKKKRRTKAQREALKALLAYNRARHSKS